MFEEGYSEAAESQPNFTAKVLFTWESKFSIRPIESAIDKATKICKS